MIYDFFQYYIKYSLGLPKLIFNIIEKVLSMLSINNLNVFIDGRHILRNINYTQQLTGKLIGVLGPNGAGKSTLFKSLLSFIRSTGSVYVDNKPLNKQLTRCAYIPQKSSIDIEFPITVIDTIRSGLSPSP